MNINNLVMQNSYIVILAIGMLLCIVTGNVDLSVGSVVAFTGGVSAILILDFHLPIIAVIPIVLILGLVIGMWQGYFIAYLHVPPLWQTVTKLAIIIFLIEFFTTRLALYQGLPFVLAIMLALIIVYTFFTKNMVSGRQVYAVGGNKKAAALSGIKTPKVMFWVYTNMGVLSALAGIVLSARNASATPKAGDMFELDAIASCFIGGASAYGGTGTVTGAVIGALIMGILNNGMSLIGWTVDMQKVIKGLVLLGAVTIDLFSKHKKD